MKQLEVRNVVTYRWWRDDGGDIDPNHIKALKEDAERRIGQCSEKGYVRGELVTNICIVGDPEDGIDYSGYWEVTRLNNSHVQNLKDAVEFYEMTLKASSEERSAVGRDHIEQLYLMAKRVIEAEGL